MDLELQKTLFSLFGSLEFPFYEGIRNEQYPYAAISYSTLQRLNTKTSKGYKLYYQIDLFSKYNGTKEVKEMANQVITLLEEPFLFGEKQCKLNDSWNFRTQVEDDVRHGILEIEFDIY